MLDGGNQRMIKADTIKRIIKVWKHASPKLEGSDNKKKSQFGTVYLSGDRSSIVGAHIGEIASLISTGQLGGSMSVMGPWDFFTSSVHDRPFHQISCGLVKLIFFLSCTVHFHWNMSWQKCMCFLGTNRAISCWKNKWFQEGPTVHHIFFHL